MNEMKPIRATLLAIHHYMIDVVFPSFLRWVSFFCWINHPYAVFTVRSWFELLPFFPEYSFVCIMKVVLTRELRRCPTFSNLKTLSLGEWCMAADFDALIFLLQHSPNIKTLFLQLKLVCVITYLVYATWSLTSLFLVFSIWSHT